jgi:hypothetical protein
MRSLFQWYRQVSSIESLVLAFVNTLNKPTTDKNGLRNIQYDLWRRTVTFSDIVFYLNNKKKCI